MVADGFMRQFRAPTPDGLCATEHIFHPSCGDERGGRMGG